MKASGIVTLTTDFGLSDPYVGAMKGVMLAINPKATCVDISHLVKAGAVAQASAILLEAYSFFPPGTVHLVVVDPGVGSKRRPLVIVTPEHLFVGPDNGLFWPIVETSPRAKAFQLCETGFFLDKVSQTFHGRDIFAPVAAHLSLGMDPKRMGPPVQDLVPLTPSKPVETEDTLYGHVVRIDHFGNLITDIAIKDLEAFLRGNLCQIKVGEMTVKGLRKTYSDVTRGEGLALTGSSGLLEVAVNSGRASEQVGLPKDRIIGSVVEVRRTREAG